MKKQYFLAAICLIVAAVFVVLDQTGAAGQNRLPPCPDDQDQRRQNCHGAYTWADGAKYAGEWKEDQVNGQGAFTWPDGRKYVGEWKDDRREGQGTFTSPNGHKYVGEYKDDRPNGRGTFTWPSGAKYVGEFKDAKYNGRGTLYAADGTVRHAGRWENNEFLGP